MVMEINSIFKTCEFHKLLKNRYTVLYSFTEGYKFVLILAGIVLILLILPGTVLCFGFKMKMMLIKQ